MARQITARVAADLIAKVRKAEGWPRVEGDSLATIRQMNALYEVTTTRDGRYVATRKEPARACLDIFGDVEGGRIVVVTDWLKANDADPVAVLTALADGRPYVDVRGAWSLTPL